MEKEKTNDENVIEKLIDVLRNAQNLTKKKTKKVKMVLWSENESRVRV